MIPSNPSSMDRASFNRAMAAILSDHVALRRLAVDTSERGFTTDDTLSLAEAMTAHEGVEARLFAQPLITRTPEIVSSTAARARRRALEYTTGTFALPDRSAAAALFVDALLAHLAAEEAWFDHESERQKERLLISA